MDDTKQNSEVNEGQHRKPSIPNVPQQQQQHHHQHHHHSHSHHSSSTIFKQLVGACKRKELETIEPILGEHPELINQRDRYNRNLLHYTVILFRRRFGGESFQQQQQSIDDDFEEADTISIAADQQSEQRISENLNCFNYLLDRCNQKLWWQQDLDGLTLLHLAVISSNNPLVKFIIYEHSYSVKYPLVCTPDNERHSALHWAVITNNLECVKLLVNSSFGLKLIHEPDFNGATPLHYATQTSDYPKYRKQLRLMLRNVASDDHQSAAIDQPTGTVVGQPKEPESRDNQRRRLMIGHTLEVLELLLKTPQVNIECRDKDRRTPLLWAASSGNRDAVLLLIGAGANPQSCDINKLGALHCAASHGFTECLESLLSVSKRGSSTTSALASERSVNQPDNLNCTPIFYAVLSGNIDCVELLADRGAQLDWQDSKGRSAAHFAALKGQLNSLKLLRRRGANLWLANRQGDLPLHYALKGGRHQVAKWLLDHSPYENSVNAINNFGRAPIHLVVQRDDSEMLDYLIRRGANLNQLVKVRDGSHAGSKRSREQFSEPKAAKLGGEYHYETALDVAKKLGHEASLRQLVENGAQIAAQVMSGRASNRSGGGGGGANVNSLFDLQSVDGPSPIRYDTSSSSATASPQQAARNEDSALPKLSRPRPDSLPQSESSGGGGGGGGGSSALSQNSLTSIRGYHGVKLTDRDQHHDVREEETSLAGEPTTKPYRGGITYNNERINASIKCKLYDNHISYPPLHQNEQTTRSHQRHRSAPTSGQEIITNVNVYTSPCPLANHHFDLQPKYTPRGHQQQQQHFGSPDGDETSDGPETSCDEANPEQPARKEHPPHADSRQRQQQHLLTSRLPPSQGHEQHLPVILSEREEVSTSGDDRSPEVGAGHFSPSKEEPRFDRSDRGRGRPVHTRKQQVKSPVAEYIRAPLPSSSAAAAAHGEMQQKPGYESHHLPDFSQVKPKVDSHREDRSRSLTRHKDQPPRSLSRQTFTREPPPVMRRHESQDSFEFELGVEKSIRKYKQEKRLFEELQGLKRSQIRSGRANEAVLVKRLVEHLKREQLAGSNDLLAMDNYTGPYTYKSYERFLYDQLRKLSQSNCAKLSKSMRDFEHELMRSGDADFSSLQPNDADDHVGMTAAHEFVDDDDDDEEEQQHRNFLEEDMQADMELRRVIEGDSAQEEPIQLELDSEKTKQQLPQIVSQEDEDTQQEPEVRRGSVASVGSSSRRSSIDVEREKLKTLPLQTTSDDKQAADDDDEETKSLIECEANSICSAIMVDALGNIAAHSTTAPKETDADEKASKEASEASNEDIVSLANDDSKSETFAQTKSRRRSVVNIGNKVEIIYHDVGIEIDHAGDATATDDEVEDRTPSMDVSKQGDEIGGTSVSDAEEMKAQAEVEEATIQTGGDDKKEHVGQQAERVKANLRRASSPPGDLRLLKETQTLAGDRRRLSSIDSGTSVGHSAHSYIAEIKKVFNGYDLDEYLERKKSRRETPEPQKRSQESERKLLIRQRSTKKRPRKERSVLPREKFVPHVDVQQIKDRWTRVKAVERARLSDRQESCRGSFGQASYLAKSQPSLERYESRAAAEERNVTQQELKAAEDPAFSLLYEINTSKRNSSRSAAKWCQSRIVKIVDVRCLKRTLSLPESVLYSNELLKRFNILKL